MLMTFYVEMHVCTQSKKRRTLYLFNLLTSNIILSNYFELIELVQQVISYKKKRLVIEFTYLYLFLVEFVVKMTK